MDRDARTHGGEGDGGAEVDALGRLVARWNDGDEDALVEICDRWGEAIIQAVHDNIEPEYEHSIYGSSDMRQTVLRWMLMYARERRVHATRPAHVEDLFRMFVRRVVDAGAKRMEQQCARMPVDMSLVPAPGEADQEEPRRLLARVRACFTEKDWDAIELVSRGVPQRMIAELQGRSYTYLRLQLARRRAAARRDFAKPPRGLEPRT